MGSQVMNKERWARLAEMYERLTPAQKANLEPLIQYVEAELAQLKILSQDLTVLQA